MTNAECRMTKEARMLKMTRGFSGFVIPSSFVIRASTFFGESLRMIRTEVPAPDFDLAITLDSGQVFHWEKVGDGFVGAIGDRPVYIEQDGDFLKVRDGESRALSRIVADYFALDHPLAEICASFPDDAIMNAARKFCSGLRIIRQPKWECLATFICSSMKQVAHIRQISKKLRERFGDARKIDPANDGFAVANNYVVYTFPSAQRIADDSEK